MTKINLIGNIFGTSGYANHTRQLFNALVNEGAEVKLDTNIVPGWELQVNNQEFSAITKESMPDAHTIMITMPHQWKLATNEPQASFNAFLIWEGDRIPYSFIKHLKLCDRIFVPSQHVKEAAQKTLSLIPKNPGNPEQETEHKKLLNKIVVIPHGVNPDIFIPKPKEPAKFVFIANKGWANTHFDRGGIQHLLRAYAQEFKENEPVLLKIKINTAYSNPQNTAQQIIDLHLPEHRAPILIETGELTQQQLAEFYNTGHCFVSPTMAEAFSLPCLEAMSCGLPVITTDYGGQTDFVNQQNGWQIKTEPQEVIHDWMYEGVFWGMPSIPELQKTMRYAYEHLQECRNKGSIARKTAEAMTWQASAQKLLKTLENTPEP